MDSDGYLDGIIDPVEEIYREIYLDEDMFELFGQKRSKVRVEKECMREELRRKRAVSFLLMGIGSKSKYYSSSMVIITDVTIHIRKIGYEKKKSRVYRNREAAWEFILTWNEELFYRQFGLGKEEFFKLCEQCKSSYPGKSRNGIKNYFLAQIRGRASSGKSGPVNMELKLAVTLRLLRGASYLDMIWYGVQISTVHEIFGFMLSLLNTVLTDTEIYNFNPQNSNFVEECNHMVADWSAVMVRRRQWNVMKGTVYLSLLIYIYIYIYLIILLYLYFYIFISYLYLSLALSLYIYM